MWLKVICSAVMGFNSMCIALLVLEVGKDGIDSIRTMRRIVSKP